MKIRLLLFILVIVLILTGCEHEDKKTSAFSNEVTEQMKETATSYSDVDFSNGDVPLHETVRLEGTIIKSDSQDNQIEKGHRFILKTEKAQYQVFNEQETTLYLDDSVTVYGEYYGFIKGILIERR
jgi:outer membrane lipoprotein-sorting protein